MSRLLVIIALILFVFATVGAFDELPRYSDDNKATERERTQRVKDKIERQKEKDLLEKVKPKVNHEGGWTELVTRILELSRFALDNSPLPECDKVLSKYYRRLDGVSMINLETKALQATAALIEWQSALEHPRPKEYAGLTDEEFGFVVGNKTIAAQKSVDVAQEKIQQFQNQTFTTVSNTIYSVCYAEARALSSAAIAEEISFDAIQSEKEKQLRKAAVGDDTEITDEVEEDPKVATGIAGQNSGKRIRNAPAYHQSTELTATSWTNRAIIYAQLHIKVLVASGMAVAKDFFDHDLMTGWKAIMSFWDNCYLSYVEWGSHGERRVRAFKKLLDGRSVTGIGGDTNLDGTPRRIAPGGEALRLGSRPGTEKNFDNKYGTISYTGKEAEQKKRAVRKEKGMKDPFTWIELTESVLVTPENAKFTALLVGSEAIVCYAVAYTMLLAAVLTVGATFAFVQISVPFLFTYHVLNRWFFRIYVRELFWNHFVVWPTTTADSVVSAVTFEQAQLNLRTLTNYAPKLPSLFWKAFFSDDKGSAAVSITAIFAIIFVVIALVTIPVVMIVWDFIGKTHGAKRTTQSLQAQRAREILAAREQERVAALAAAKPRHSHSHGGAPCSHSHR